MPPRELARAAEPSLHCTHCGRAVRETEHTRTAYSVDYYSVYSGHGERSYFAGELGQRGGAYIKLVDRFDVTTCVECYRRASVQTERDRAFQPERDASSEESGET